MTQTEIRGLAQKELEVLRRKRTDLEEAGLKVDQLEEKLVKLLGDAVAEDARQEFLKIESKASTARATTAYDTLYEAASGLLDAVMGVLGKNSDEARVLQRMRSDVRRPGTPTEEASLPV
ncbi:MAG: hypothetical protein HY557_08530 [Euryarchaeota archaeon]|nr:hypothetical protein [Euryarchaeota archaeon]